MGSGGSRDDYVRHVETSYRSFASDDADERRRAEADRRARMEEARSRAHAGTAPPPPKRDTREVFDAGSIASRITRPASTAERVHVFLVDNSGSNRLTAQKVRDSSGYLLGIMRALDPGGQMAVIYFSDHCDGPHLMQEVDYVSPTEAGDRVLFSTTSKVVPAGGGDEPEAIECAFHRATELDFGHVTERHLYLVTDVLAHEMGMRDDRGCPDQRNWQRELERVREVYTTFTIVGSSDDQRIGAEQRRFLKPERAAYDLIDLSSIPQLEYRLGIVGNALLFLMARNRGPQTVELFLSLLYEKWLREPLFGANTDLNARQAIMRFLKYLELSEEEKLRLQRKIFAD